MGTPEDERAIERAVSRLLENERLTAGLEDAPAQRLLKWGIRQLEAGAAGPTVDQAVRALGRLVQQRSELTCEEAQATLEQAGVKIPLDALAALWSEREALAAAQWTDKLVQQVAEASPPPPLPTGEEPPEAGPAPSLTAGEKPPEAGPAPPLTATDEGQEPASPPSLTAGEKPPEAGPAPSLAARERRRKESFSPIPRWQFWRRRP